MKLRLRLFEYADIFNHWAQTYHLDWFIPHGWFEYCCKKMNEALEFDDEV